MGKKDKVWMKDLGIYRSCMLSRQGAWYYSGVRSMPFWGFYMVMMICVYRYIYIYIYIIFRDVCFE